jgi:hypothetical protein
VRQRRTANHKAALAVVDDVREVRASAGNDLGSERPGESTDARSQVLGERLQVESGGDVTERASLVVSIRLPGRGETSVEP